MKKTTLKTATKSTQKVYRVGQSVQKHVRKFEPPPADYNELDRVKLNLSQMVAGTSDAEKVKKYQALAKELSTTAKLNNGRLWSWRYVVSVKQGTIKPGKKFVEAVLLYTQRNNRCKRWFYFAHHHYVASIYEKKIRAEIIRSHMQAMSFREVTYSQYIEIKKRRS